MLINRFLLRVQAFNHHLFSSLRPRNIAADLPNLTSAQLSPSCPARVTEICLSTRAKHLFVVFFTRLTHVATHIRDSDCFVPTSNNLAAFSPFPQLEHCDRNYFARRSYPTVVLSSRAASRLPAHIHPSSMCGLIICPTAPGTNIETYLFTPPSDHHPAKNSPCFNEVALPNRYYKV